MASGTIPVPRTQLIAESIVTSATVSSTGTTQLSAYGSRKFTDYGLIIFKCGTSGDEWRVSQTLPISMWTSGTTVFLTGVHGSSLENRSGVSIAYSSDTKANASLTGSKAFTEVQILGIKLL